MEITNTALPTSYAHFAALVSAHKIRSSRVSNCAYDSRWHLDLYGAKGLGTAQITYIRPHGRGRAKFRYQIVDHRGAAPDLSTLDPAKGVVTTKGEFELNWCKLREFVKNFYETFPAPHRAGQEDW